ncbi:MAG TPA: phospholipase D-like domain-containing protein [Polyangiales bacterium]|nr:phospholipase D-like domain-containing protein [Polyangiales bacterium]
MTPAATPAKHRDEALSSVRELAQQAFSRASGSPLREGNAVRLLLDARENYSAWLEAIAAAERYVHFETYIFADDPIGRTFADALIASSERGVRVRVLYDWLGCLGKASQAFWQRLRAAGVEVRCYNPPRWDAPLAILSRDHRKLVSVDGERAFVSGLCVGQEWVGDEARGIAPWRDTGVELRGPAVAYLERAFGALWATLGEPIAEAQPVASLPRGNVAVRVVASEPSSAGMLRIDQLVATLATQRLWLSDPYYAGTAPYMQALSAAVKDGVDVRVLVPGTTDVPLLKPLSRTGYRALLEVGVRVFEWNGTMMHAKTAVADDRWARVGSTNLNLASWIGNYELDVLIEDEAFARCMADAYLADLENATELVLDGHRKLRAPGRAKPGPSLRHGRGSAGRAAAGALRIGNAVGAALSHQRVLRVSDARVTAAIGALLIVLAVLVAAFPRVLAYCAAFLLAWSALILLYNAFKLMRSRVRGA